MKKITPYLLLICLGLQTEKLSAQLDNSFFNWHQTPLNKDSGRLSVHIDQLYYAQNKELETAIDEGVTYLGFQFIPRLDYQITKNVSVTGGAFFKHDFGTPNFHQILPVVSLQFRNKVHTFRIGTLEGATDHRLPELVLGYSRVLNQRIENGLQWKVHTPKYRSDFWLNWERAIYTGSPYNELIQAGWVTDYEFSADWTAAYFKPKFSLLVYHSGGEIDNNGGPVTTQLNNTIEGELGWKWGPDKKIFVGGLASFYDDFSEYPADTFFDGEGYMAYAGFKWNNLMMQAQFWDAFEYTAPLGEKIYHSISARERHQVLFYRQFFAVRGQYEKKVNDQLSLMGRINLFYDTQQGTFEHILGFYVRWKLGFELGNIPLKKL